MMGSCIHSFTHSFIHSFIHSLKCHWDQNFGISYFCIFESSLWFKVQLITTTGSRFFRTVFVDILRPPLLALVPEAGLRIGGSDVRDSPQTLHSAGNLTVVEGRFRANCLFYGLEIFVAAAVMKGITCVVQCYNNKSVH